MFYQELTGVDDTEKKLNERRRKAEYAARVIGDLPVDQYKRAQANELVAHLLKDGKKTQTVRRYLNYITPVIKVALREWEIEKSSVFEGLRIPNLGSDSVDRNPFSVDEIRMMQSACRLKDDDIRHLIALVSDTGVRLAEAVGLTMQDISLKGPVPYINLRVAEHRPLKTPQSVRKVPLVGAALWAAERLCEERGDAFAAFPRYRAADGKVLATSASNARSKYLHSLGLPEGKTMHSFRHAMRDRLRNAGVAEEPTDKLLGWAHNSVGRGYGKGHSIEFLHNEMLKIVLD